MMPLRRSGDGSIEVKRPAGAVRIRYISQYQLAMLTGFCRVSPYEIVALVHVIFREMDETFG
jgi:hypothetical protein